MIHLGFLLHIYQPPQQIDDIMLKIADECYRPLLRLINSREDARFTMNVNWSLTERWLQDGYSDLVESLGRAVRSSRIEVTSSAAYHAILPLIPRSERARQILLNDERSRGIYGPSWQPRGIFPPEMAFGHEVVQMAAPLGYRWTITDDAAYDAVHHEVPSRYVATADDFPVLMRSGMWSNRVSMEQGADGKPRGGAEMARWLASDMRGWFGEEDGYVILAMDGETFGHHLKGHIENFLEPFLDTIRDMPDMRLVHLSDIVERFPKREMGVPPGSWSTSREDFWNGDFFPLWKGHENQAHELLWELTELAHRGIDHMHQMLDQGLNSCTFWWVGRSDGEMSPMTLGGIYMLMDIVAAANPTHMQRAEAIQSQLLALLGPLPATAAKLKKPRPLYSAPLHDATRHTSTGARK